MPRISRNQPSRRKCPQAPAVIHELARLEFFRHAAALMPDSSDPFPGIAYEVASNRDFSGRRFCSCKKSGKATRDHLKDLSRIAHAFNLRCQPDAAEAFMRSPWHRLAAVLADDCRETLETIELMTPKTEGGLVVTGWTKTPLLVYHSNKADALRLIERCTNKVKRGGPPSRKSGRAPLCRYSRGMGRL